LDRGYDQTDEEDEVDVVEVEVFRPGQLVTVGLHWVIVRVCVMVDVDVVVPSWAATREAQAARMLMMLVNCIVMLGIFAGQALQGRYRDKSR
jgi:hypothetical protein